MINHSNSAIVDQLYHKIIYRLVGSLGLDEYLYLELNHNIPSKKELWTLKISQNDYLFFDTKQEALNIAMLRGLKVHCSEDIARDSRHYLYNIIMENKHSGAILK